MVNDVFEWYVIESTPLIPAGLGAVGTLFLALVTIRTLSQNENLIEHQQTQLENQKAQLKPRLRQIGHYNTLDNYRNSIILELQNIGGGKAFDISIIPELYIINGNDYTSLEDYSKKRSRSDETFPTLKPTKTPARKVDFHTEIRVHPVGGTLEVDEIDKFTARISYQNESAKQDLEQREPEDLPPTVVFDRLIHFLGSTDIEHLAFQFVVTYKDVLGNSETENLHGPIFALSETEELSDTFHYSRWIKELNTVSGPLAPDDRHDKNQS